jgi:hypothetical protein
MECARGEDDILLGKAEVADFKHPSLPCLLPC